jgi:hypothetical protein
LHAAQRIDALQIDDPRRRDDAFLHEIEQIHAARFGDRRAALILASNDTASSTDFASIHCRLLMADPRRAARQARWQDVIGSVRIRLPVAL